MEWNHAETYFVEGQHACRESRDECGENGEGIVEVA